MNIDEVKEKLNTIFEELKNKLAELKEKDLSEREKLLKDIRVKFTGKKAKISLLLGEMKNVPNEQKGEFGSLINKYKIEIYNIIENAEKTLREKKINEKLEKETVDITLPVEEKTGKLHPINQIIDECVKIFTQMGYNVMDGPEIEKTEYVFDKLNTPKHHPARDIQDTFYLEDEVVLRSHTSSVQIRTMLNNEPPIKIICPGAVYRSDTIDKTHSPIFHQLEGLVIDKNVKMSDLKGTLEVALKKLLGDKIRLKFRPHYFAYTEPSVEVDVSCFVCDGKGCSTCKGEGWIELLGAGMVHPDVLRGCGIDPEIYSGFAFGFGLERLAMAKYNIDDMRLLYENDKRFLEQF